MSSKSKPRSPVASLIVPTRRAASLTSTLPADSPPSTVKRSLASTGTYELRLYWLCRQHAALDHAEEEWGESIGDLLEWERALEEARKATAKEEIIVLLEGKRNEMRRLCNEFAAYADSLKYTGKGKHPLE
jgi:hypothetical protein